MPTPVQSAFARARWTEDDARVVLAALDRSGQSVRAFAEEHGLDPQRLYAWRRRVAGGDRITFHEVTVRPERLAAAHDAPLGAFEIVLASGAVIRVPPAFDAAALARLLEVVERTRAC
jgi:transposase-like protein